MITLELTQEEAETLFRLLGHHHTGQGIHTERLYRVYQKLEPFKLKVKPLPLNPQHHTEQTLFIAAPEIVVTFKLPGGVSYKLPEEAHSVQQVVVG